MKYFFLFSSCLLITIFVVLLLDRKLVISTKSTKIRIFENKKNELENFLAQANIKISTFQFILSYTFLYAFSFAIINAISRTPLLSLVLSTGICFVPYLIICKQRTNTLRELMNSWPDALRDINSSITAGYSLSSALKSIATTGPEPIKTHLSRFSNLEKTIGFNAALETIKNEMNDATSDKIIEILIVANERGGKIVKEIISDLIVSISDDIALADAIATENIEMKINSRAVVVIPWGVLLLLTLSGGVFRDYYSSKPGVIVIFIGIAMSILGIYVLSKLSKLPEQKRVFTTATKANE